MLGGSGQLPINSVAVVSSASNDEVATLVTNLLNDVGISTCLHIELPVSNVTSSRFLHRFIISVDKLLSRLLAGSKVPDIIRTPPYCPTIAMEDFVGCASVFLNKIDCYILIGHDNQFCNILPAEIKRPLFKLTLGSVNDAPIGLSLIHI